MRLYQHSTHCPIAMQIFLDANPQYWRFVPMPIEEAEKPEQISVQPYEMSHEMSPGVRTKHDCLDCVQSIPKPPRGYTFSKRQILLQTQYLHTIRDNNLPNLDIDLYDATIVAVCKYYFKINNKFIFTYDIFYF